ncbi:hydrolase 2, exosortase A system-associated [Nitrosomonas sp. HPC101]|uniref:hydrolase 2, exosortase A system-associated n=1 Tax=Nitrosomonas sp. HPC101 TaxID=1658667 RepID=UPI00136CF3CE|nr:hydrolase 2, exosortase A system-associated [Nitrosomonas sp. HPC101]MXS85769.1 hydrolase 2, exosortase A system-associated [Nitrosomonas sp. HPC101]
MDNNPPAEPFFLDASPGKRFCIYHPPVGNPLNQALLYIHPFAEEMNKSRRMAALQAKAFATMGFGVLQVDLYGCGDSEGDFGEATWAIWKEDIAYASQWLMQQGFASVHFWGVRLGALLVLDYVNNEEARIDPVKLVLWQPVVNGKSFLTQFLRLKLVNRLMSDDMGKTENVQDFREKLGAGEALEIAGYTLSPAMAAAIDALRLDQLVVEGSEVYWFEITPDAERGLSPASTSVVEAWNQSGIYPEVTLIPGLPFWATQEISECPELLMATARTFESFAGIPA